MTEPTKEHPLFTETDWLRQLGRGGAAAPRGLPGEAAAVRLLFIDGLRPSVRARDRARATGAVTAWLQEALRDAQDQNVRGALLPRLFMTAFEIGGVKIADDVDPGCIFDSGALLLGLGAVNSAAVGRIAGGEEAIAAGTRLAWAHHWAVRGIQDGHALIGSGARTGNWNLVWRSAEHENGCVEVAVAVDLGLGDSPEGYVRIRGRGCFPMDDDQSGARFVVEVTMTSTRGTPPISVVLLLAPAARRQILKRIRPFVEEEADRGVREGVAELPVPQD